MNMVNLIIINDNSRIQGWALGHKKYWQMANPITKWINKQKKYRLFSHALQGEVREFDSPTALLSRDSMFARLAKSAGIHSVPSTVAV
jgi:hypothetical protein